MLTGFGGGQMVSGGHPPKTSQVPGNCHSASAGRTADGGLCIRTHGPIVLTPASPSVQPSRR